MKCRQCGYVSFDNLTECKKCGASFAEAEEEKESPVESRLQEELFSLSLDAGEEEQPSGAGDHRSPESVEPPAAAGEPAADPGVEAATEPFFEEETGGDPPEERRGGETGPAPVEAPREEVELPDLRIDFDPGAETVDDPAAEKEYEAGETAEDAGRGVIADETHLPEDLWVEEGAGFVPRFLAFALDAAVLAALVSLFFLAASLVLGDAGGLTAMAAPEKVTELFVPFYLLGVFLSLSYFTFFLGWAGRTPGKALLRLDVRRTDGGKMTYSRAFLRWVGYLVSITFAGLGFLWIFFDERKRGWHDYLSGTWVKDLRSGD